MTATSDSGTTGYQRASASGTTSSRSGEKWAMRMPRRCASARCPRSPWRAIPPGATKVFLCGSPPNATSSSVCFAITFQVVALRNTAAELPTRCGSRTSDAPML